MLNIWNDFKRIFVRSSRQYFLPINFKYLRFRNEEFKKVVLSPRLRKFLLFSVLCKYIGFILFIAGMLERLPKSDIQSWISFIKTSYAFNAGILLMLLGSGISKYFFSLPAFTVLSDHFEILIEKELEDKKRVEYIIKERDELYMNIKDKEDCGVNVKKVKKV